MARGGACLLWLLYPLSSLFLSLMMKASKQSQLYARRRDPIHEALLSKLTQKRERFACGYQRLIASSARGGSVSSDFEVWTFEPRFIVVRVDLLSAKGKETAIRVEVCVMRGKRKKKSHIDSKTLIRGLQTKRPFVDLYVMSKQVRFRFLQHPWNKTRYAIKDGNGRGKGFWEGKSSFGKGPFAAVVYPFETVVDEATFNSSFSPSPPRRSLLFYDDGWCWSLQIVQMLTLQKIIITYAWIYAKEVCRKAKSLVLMLETNSLSLCSPSLLLAPSLIGLKLLCFRYVHTFYSELLWLFRHWRLCEKGYIESKAAPLLSSFGLLRITHSSWYQRVFYPTIFTVQYVARCVYKCSLPISGFSSDKVRVAKWKCAPCVARVFRSGRSKARLQIFWPPYPLLSHLFLVDLFLTFDPCSELHLHSLCFRAPSNRHRGGQDGLKDRQISDKFSLSLSLTRTRDPISNGFWKGRLCIGELEKYTNGEIRRGSLDVLQSVFRKRWRAAETTPETAMPLETVFHKP